MAGFYADFRVTTDQIINEQKSVGKRKRQRKNNVRGILISSNLIIESATVVNNTAGLYTGNKIKQANVKSALGMTVKSVGAIATFAKTSSIAGPVVGAVVTGAGIALDAITTTSKTIINQVNAQQEYDYKTSLIGNATTSSSRWRGNYR